MTISFLKTQEYDKFFSVWKNSKYKSVVLKENARRRIFEVFVLHEIPTR